MDNAHTAVTLEARAKAATKERFKHRLASADQRNGYEVGYFEALATTRNADAQGETA